jgi:hypothetical protein
MTTAAKPPLPAIDPLLIEMIEESHNVRREFFSETEIRALLSYLPNDGLRDFVEFASISGWEKNEISSIRWEHVDQGEIGIPGQFTFLVEWHPGSRLTRLPNSEAPNANGVQLSADREFIYYTAWSGKQIRKYDRHFGHVVETANVAFYPDNISVRADGVLVVTGMDELQSWKACVLAKCSFCQTGLW